MWQFNQKGFIVKKVLNRIFQELTIVINKKSTKFVGYSFFMATTKQIFTVICCTAACCC